jgi:3D (Asp-Asp-Asp) domain-containing protein
LGERSGFFKISELDSSQLDNNTEVCQISRGEVLSLLAPALEVGNHYFVRLSDSLSEECQFQEGYIHRNFVSSISKKLPVNAGNVLRTFSSFATLYTTEPTTMEGGPFDRCDNDELPADQRRLLATLEDFVAGKTNWVALAMDKTVVPYGTVIRIPKIEEELKRRGVYNGRPIIFVVTDGGGHFNGEKGWTAFDLCVGDSQGDIKSAMYRWMSGTTFDMKVLKEGDGTPPRCGRNFRPDYR